MTGPNPQDDPKLGNENVEDGDTEVTSEPNVAAPEDTEDTTDTEDASEA